jgi:hypothetical protein
VIQAINSTSASGLITSFGSRHIADPEHQETKAQSQRLAKALQEAGESTRTYHAEEKTHDSINADLGLPMGPLRPE